MGQAASPNKSIADAMAAFSRFGAMPTDGGNLPALERLAAAIDSANYLNSSMAGCVRYDHSYALLTAGMLARSIPNGLILEFGVYSGRTVSHIASFDAGKVFGFDSFEGLPEDWRNDFRKGAFKRTDLPSVAANVELVVGWFNTSPRRS